MEAGVSVSDCPPDVHVKRRASITAPPKPIPVEYRRCTRKNCTWCIHETSTYKTCAICRDRVVRFSKTDKGKAAISKKNKSEKTKVVQNRYYKSEKGKACAHRANTSAKGKATKAAWRKTENGKANAKKHTLHTPKAKERIRRNNKEIMNQLAKSLSTMVSGKHLNPTTFPRMGVFSSNADARQHFQLHFAPWMSFDNQGVLKAGMGYNVKWQIGHGIPKKAYDPTNDEDLLKCWSRDNLRPQCARENNELRDRLPSHDWLNARSHLWPAAWNGRIPTADSV